MGTENKILVVDDEPNNILALCAVLKAEGYQTLSASSAVNGIELLKSTDNIKLVLMDIMMPDMDGYEAAEIIRKDVLLKNAPIIALTARAMDEDRKKCLAAGFNDYIAKPVNVVLLRDMLKKHIG